MCCKSYFWVRRGNFRGPSLANSHGPFGQLALSGGILLRRFQVCYACPMIPKQNAKVLALKPKPFPWLSSLLYGGVLLAGIYYQLIGICGGLFLSWRVAAFVGILLFLVAMEQFERYATSPTSRRLAILQLLGRMALFEIVVMLDCSGFSKFLYLIVPFVAYFSLGKKISYGLAIFYVGIFVTRLWSVNVDWFLNESYVADLLIFAIGLVFVLAMADVVSEAQENRSRAETLLDTLATSHRKLKTYAAQVAELAAAEERNRLARDIHDSLGHSLTAINVQLEKALTFRQHDPTAADQAVRDAKRSAKTALQDVRQSVGAIRRTEESFSLTAVLPELVATMSNGHLTINLDIQGEETDYSKLVLMTIYRAAQEALTNIQKHAQASQATVEVSLASQEARLSIGDNGRGFDTEKLENLPAERDSSFGLQGIQERLELVGGTMQLTSSPNQGTELLIMVPKNPLKLDNLSTTSIGKSL